MSKLLVLVGPTGVGKTALGMRLAADTGISIVSADSRQVYCGLEVGVCSPTAEERVRVKHYFVGERDILEDYNAGMYERDCIDVLNRLHSECKGLPYFSILLGGSMLYVDAVCYGLDAIPEVSEEIKLYCEGEYKRLGLGWLQEAVKLCDRGYWEVVDRNNPVRLLHCLEVTLMSGVPYSAYRRGVRKGCSVREWGYIKVGLYRDREELYRRIDSRVDRMLCSGLLEEARGLYDSYVRGRDLGGSKSYPNSLNTVGYKELFGYFAGYYTYEEAVRMIKRNTRHYAKRQMTWWRGQDDIHWIDANEEYEKIRVSIFNFVDVCY